MNEVEQTLIARIANLEERVVNLERTVATFIGWTAQAANSPISTANASRLAEMLAGQKFKTYSYS